MIINAKNFTFIQKPSLKELEFFYKKSSVKFSYLDLPEFLEDQCMQKALTICSVIKISNPTKEVFAHKNLKVALCKSSFDGVWLFVYKNLNKKSQKYVFLLTENLMTRAFVATCNVKKIGD